MDPQATEKFLIKNIDCPNCAAKIENSLTKLAGVGFVSLNFATQTLHLKADDLDRVMEQIRKIDSDVELIPQDEQGSQADIAEASPGYRLKRELLVLVAALSLFSVVLLFGDRLGRQPFGSFALVLTLSAYILAGWNVFVGALRTVRRGSFFDENVLMVIATVGAIAIHAYAEAIAVMIFYKVGEMLQELAVDRSRRSIRGLLAARPSRATLKTLQGFQEVPPESVAVGDIILVKPGEKVPLDGQVIDGVSQVDASALTGESRPLSVKPGKMVMAGMISDTGALTVEVTREFKDSSIAKVMDLVENATARKARTEKFITTFARYYTPAVVVIAAGIATLPPLLTGASFETWIYRALVMLVISCPCALVVSIPLGYFGGIGRASRRGILVKGSNFIDALAAVKTVVFDKTGTLTRGVFKVNHVVSSNGFSESRLLEFAAAAETQSNHPIAASILAAFDHTGGKIDAAKVSDHTNHPGLGVTATYNGRRILVGNDNFLHRESVEHSRCEFDTTVVHVSIDGTYAGYITVGDELKPDAQETIRMLKGMGVEHVAMLTGDNACAASAVAGILELDSFQADLYPEEKVAAFEKLIGAGAGKGKTAFVGDGINDAPVIARADVGVAMGALGSDAAIETADVVLMADSPRQMAEAVSIAKLTRRIVWQNIGLAFSIKAVFLSFGAMGLASMWEAVFADMGTALLAVANSTRIIGKKTGPDA